MALDQKSAAAVSVIALAVGWPCQGLGQDPAEPRHPLSVSLTLGPAISLSEGVYSAMIREGWDDDVCSGWSSCETVTRYPRTTTGGVLLAEVSYQLLPRFGAAIQSRWGPTVTTVGSQESGSQYPPFPDYDYLEVKSRLTMIAPVLIIFFGGPARVQVGPALYGIKSWAELSESGGLPRVEKAIRQRKERTVGGTGGLAVSLPVRALRLDLRVQYSYVGRVTVGPFVLGDDTFPRVDPNQDFVFLSLGIGF